MEHDVLELPGIIIVMSGATHAMQRAMNHTHVVVQWYRQVPMANVAKLSGYLCNIHSVWLHCRFNKYLSVFMSHCCLHRMFLQHYRTIHPEKVGCQS